MLNTLPHHSNDQKEQYLLHISCKEHRFCLPLNQVERLMLLMEVQTVPQAPDYLIGLMNLYGEAVPVIDLALRIGIHHNDSYTIQTPLVLLNDKHQKAAFIIDNIEGVKPVSQEQLRGEKLFQGGQPPVKATVAMPDGAALLLDSSRILDLDLSELGISLELGEDLLSLCRMTVEKDQPVESNSNE